MPEFGYSIMGLDPETTAIASGRDLRSMQNDKRDVLTGS